MSTELILEAESNEHWAVGYKSIESVDPEEKYDRNPFKPSGELNEQINSEQLLLLLLFTYGTIRALGMKRSQSLQSKAPRIGSSSHWTSAGSFFFFLLRWEKCKWTSHYVELSGASRCIIYAICSPAVSNVEAPNVNLPVAKNAAQFIVDKLTSTSVVSISNSKMPK